MRDSDIKGKFEEIDLKFTGLGDFQAKIDEIESYRVTAAAAAEATSRAKETVDQNSGVVTELRQVLDQQKAAIESQNKIYEELKQKSEELAQRASTLADELERQLGFANAKILANSFEDKASELKSAIDRWFKLLIASILALVVASVAVVLWETKTTNAFFSANFVIKATITTPFIFFVLFVFGNYNKDKGLKEEYDFKGAVALSFEAYRQLVKEEVRTTIDNNLSSMALDFYIKSISGIFAKPQHKTNPEIASLSKDEIGLVDQLVTVFKKIIGR